MPKIVDHDARRREIVLATWRLIDTGGIAGATTREIAREAGYSNGILSHYFENREEILALAMITAHQGVRERTNRGTSGLRGLASLRIMMLESLPLDDQRRLEARIEACFWGGAVGNQELMKFQNSEVESWCIRVGVRLEEARADGHLASGVDTDVVIDELLALMDSFSIQAVLNPERLPPERQVQHLDRLLQRITAE